MGVKKLVTELKNKLSRTSDLASYVVFYCKYAKHWSTHHL